MLARRARLGMIVCDIGEAVFLRLVFAMRPDEAATVSPVHVVSRTDIPVVRLWRSVLFRPVRLEHLTVVAREALLLEGNLYERYGAMPVRGRPGWR
jgi:hypothetical protein